MVKKLLVAALVGILGIGVCYGAGITKFETSSKDAASSVLYGTADSGDNIVRLKTDATGNLYVAFQGPYKNVSTTAFTADDATPSVSAGNAFRTANANPTSITNFDNGADSQVIFVHINDNNTTIVNNSTIQTQDGANFTAVAGNAIVFMYDTNKWYELGRGGYVGAYAPANATYITQTTNATLTAEQALSDLSSGIMRVATTTGVITSLTDSAGIASNISDETGTGVLVFGTSPSILTSIDITPSATGAMLIEGDTNVRTGTNPLLDIDASYDTTTATADVETIDVDITRAATDTGGITGLALDITTNNMANAEISKGLAVTVNNGVATTATSNLIGIMLTLNDATGTCNEYGLYVGNGWDYSLQIFDDAAFGDSTHSANLALHDASTITVFEDGDNFSASAQCKDAAAEWLFNDDVNIGATGAAENLYVSGTMQTGVDGTDGSLAIFSEQGASDYTATLLANTAMTSNASFYLPADEPAGESLLTMGTDGVIDYTSLGTGVAGWISTPSSANLATAVTDETGSGALVFATSPTFVTPILGTPTSGTLTNCTLPVGGLTGLGANVATWLATPSSANLIAAVTDETGTGALVFGTSPTFTTQITVSGTGAGEIDLLEAGTTPTYYTKIVSGDLTGADSTYTLPTGYPAANNGFLLSTTAGVMSWGTASADLLGALSDETGTGVAVFGTAPTFTTSATLNGYLSATDSTANPVGKFFVDQNSGTINPDAVAGYFEIDQEAGATISNNAYALYLKSDLDGTVVGGSYMIYLDDLSGVSYGIYQNGTAINHLNGKLGVGPNSTSSHLFSVGNTALDTTASINAVDIVFTKTAGVTDASDYLVGINSLITMNDGDSTIGALRGAYLQASLSDGTVGVDLKGTEIATTCNDAVSGDLYGLHQRVNHAAGTVSGNLYGIYSDVDSDGTVTGTVYGLYLNEQTGVDYGIYQNGQAPNVLLGTLDLGADDDISTLTIHDAGTIVMKDDSDDTSVTIGPVEDGTAELGITGSLDVSSSVETSELYLNVNVSDPAVNGELNYRNNSSVSALISDMVSRFSTTSNASVDDATVANTTDETSLVGTMTGTQQIPSNYFKQGKILRITGMGHLSTKATTAGTLRIQAKLGATVILDTTATTVTDNLTTMMWKFEGMITCRSIGDTGTVIGQGEFKYHTAAGTEIPLAMINTSAITIDTTGALAMDLTADWGTADAGNTITCTNWVIEELN